MMKLAARERKDKKRDFWICSLSSCFLLRVLLLSSSPAHGEGEREISTSDNREERKSAEQREERERERNASGLT
jgi:hypothetical protein